MDAEDIRLTSFDEETAFGLIGETGIAKEKSTEIQYATRGFRTYSHWNEEETEADADSALFAKKVFDRTTRWMTPREQEWFATCATSRRSMRKIRTFFTEEEVPLVQDWFERESSIRDPASRSFQMRPLVRKKTLRYLKTRSPSRHREMLRKAQELDHQGSNGAS